MKVLLINGSPHEKGCTYTTLSLIAGELNASGIETEILNVGTKPVGGCIGCGGCAAGKGCVFGGVVNEAIEKAKTADAFVFGTPVHYASASGNMTSFMDRLAYAGGKYLAYKPAAICASARRAGTTTTLDQLVKYPEFFHMPLVSGSYWPMVHGSKPEQRITPRIRENRADHKVSSILTRNAPSTSYWLKSSRNPLIRPPLLRPGWAGCSVRRACSWCPWCYR